MKQERLGHVNALLGEKPKRGKRRPGRPSKSEGNSTPTAHLLAMAVEVLRGRKGEAMHYRELAAELQTRGATIRGQDPAVALLSRMTQDVERRFVRPTSKGFYALREDYPDARNVGERRRG